MDVTAVAWQKSSYSGDNGGNCVEVGTVGPAVAIRDSKHPDGLRLAFAAATWKAFIEQVKASALARISTGNAGPFRPIRRATWLVCQEPVVPSMRCRSRSARPLCRAYSSIMWV
jgi:hypothetical protein